MTICNLLDFYKKNYLICKIRRFVIIYLQFLLDFSNQLHLLSNVLLESDNLIQMFRKFMYHILYAD